MSKQIPKNLLDYANEVQIKHDVSEDVIIDILANLPKIDFKEYEPAFVVEKKLGLSPRYFSKALRNKVEIKAQIIKYYDHIYVRIDEEISTLLKHNYICMKTKPNEAADFEKTISLTRSTLLGFYK